MGQEANIGPALKSWLDNVLVPAMVREYLAVQYDVGDNGLIASPSKKIGSPILEPIQ